MAAIKSWKDRKTMNNVGRSHASFVKMISVLAVGIIVFTIFPFSVFAFDSGYVGNAEYWNDKGTVVTIKNGNVDCMLKYIIDEDDGCAYFFLTFTDKDLTSSDGSNIYLNFKVKNSKNTYSFSVNRNGFSSKTTDTVKSSIDLYYDFSNVSLKSQIGLIYAAFRLTDSQDRKLCNTISCEYTSKHNNTFDLLKSVELDMEPTTTTKTTTTTTSKTTTTKASATTTTKTSATKSSASSTTKFTTSTTKNSNSKTTTQASTKFTADVGTTSKSSSSNSTKFTTSSGGGSGDDSGELYEYDAGDEDSVAEDSVSESENSENSSTVSTESDSQGSGLTTFTKLLIAFATTVLLIGIVLVIFPLLADRRKSLESDSDDQTEQQEVDNNLDDDKVKKKDDKE